MSVQVEGIKETIRELKNIDPEIRRSFNRNVKVIVRPVIQEAQRKYRAETYPSGTARNWKNKFPLSGDAAARATTSSIKTSRKNTSTILIVNKNPGASVFEFADTGSLGAAFRGKNGAPARTLWPSTTKNMPEVVQQMSKLVAEVEVLINGRMNR
jgi:hypothetical protein